MGHPISHSPHSGFGFPPANVGGLGNLPSENFKLGFKPFMLQHVGVVSQHPYSLAVMRGTILSSPQNSPSCIKPHFGQVSENSLKAPSKQSCDVLHDDVTGSYFANNSGVLRP